MKFVLTPADIVALPVLLAMKVGVVYNAINKKETEDFFSAELKTEKSVLKEYLGDLCSYRDSARDIVYYCGLCIVIGSSMDTITEDNDLTKIFWKKREISKEEKLFLSSSDLREEIKDEIKNISKKIKPLLKKRRRG